MCRSIKTLRTIEHTDDDIRAAALQFVRKISGFRAPSRANTEVFDRAVDEVTLAAQRLLGGLATRAPATHTHDGHTHDGHEHGDHDHRDHDHSGHSHEAQKAS
jgi:hypothetical protein